MPGADPGDNDSEKFGLPLSRMRSRDGYTPLNVLTQHRGDAETADRRPPHTCIFDLPSTHFLQLIRRL